MSFQKFISYLLHPIIFPTVGTILYFILLPKHVSEYLQYTILAAVFIGTYIIPVLLLLFLKLTNSIHSYQLDTPEERKFPLVFMIVLFFLLGKMFFNYTIIHDLSLLFYGCAFSLIISYLFLFRKLKISLHMIGIGGMIAFLLLFSITYKINLLLLIAACFILAGFIGASRLHLNAHVKKEVYFGFLIGVFAQFVIFAAYSI